MDDANTFQYDIHLCFLELQLKLSILLHFKCVGMRIPRYQHVPFGALGEPEYILLHYKRFSLEKNPPPLPRYKRLHYTVQSEKPNINRTVNSNMVVHRGINNFVFIHTFPTFLGGEIVYFRSQEKFEDTKGLPSRRNSKERHFNRKMTKKT